MSPSSRSCKQPEHDVSLPSAHGSLIPSNVKGKDLFDSTLWKDPCSTSVFYRFIASLRKKIREEVKQTTPTHRFIRTLRDSKRLMRCYTQNIDGLETREGLCVDLSKGKGARARFTKKSISSPKFPARQVLGGDQNNGCEVVQLHGDLATLRCTSCQKTCGWEEDGREAMLLSGNAPECFSCTLQDQGRRNRGKRGTKIGVLRPNIVLYGEEHPSADAVSTITTHDLGFAPDALLIMGTSLHVHGLKVLVREFAKSVHARAGGKGKVIFVNLSRPSESVWKDIIDYWVCMDCDDWIGALKCHRPDLWHIQSELTPQVTKATCKAAQPHSIKVAKPANEEEKENPSGVLRTPPKMKERTSTSRSRMPLSDTTGTAFKRTSNSLPGSSSEKNLKRKQSTTLQQLPTPPSTGRTARSWKESREVPDSEEDFPSTPCKRSRPEVMIYQEPTPKHRRLETARRTLNTERMPLANAQARSI